LNLNNSCWYKILKDWNTNLDFYNN
jgi:hypothetical protein